MAHGIRDEFGPEEKHLDSLAMLLKAKIWLVKVMPFLARWGSNTTPNP
jgi:hypothetical protein